MASRPKPASFALTHLTLHVAGAQKVQVDGHITTQRGSRRSILTVRVGDLIIYCYDAASMTSFFRAWIAAYGMGLRMPLPEEIRPLTRSRCEAGIVLRVDGDLTHQVHGIPAGASPTDTDLVRVRVGDLTVWAHDRAAISSWKEAWQRALVVAEGFWPRSDAFDEVEAEAKAAVARRGKKARKSALRQN